MNGHQEHTSYPTTHCKKTGFKKIEPVDVIQVEQDGHSQMRFGKGKNGLLINDNITDEKRITYLIGIIP